MTMCIYIYIYIHIYIQSTYLYLETIYLYNEPINLYLLSTESTFCSFFESTISLDIFILCGKIISNLYSHIDKRMFGIICTVTTFV